MTKELAKVVAQHALPHPINSDEPQSYTLSQDHVPENLWHEADVVFGDAAANGGRYVVDSDDYNSAEKQAR